MLVETRSCPDCKIDKAFTEYWPSKYTKNKLDVYCKECKNKRTKPLAKLYQQTIPGIALGMRNRARTRAKEKTLDFNLTKQFIVNSLEQGKCEVTGIPFNLAIRRGPCFPSLDRINPNKGYTEDNVQIVIWIYNAAKSTYEHSDVVKLAKAILGDTKSWL